MKFKPTGFDNRLDRNSERKRSQDTLELPFIEIRKWDTVRLSVERLSGVWLGHAKFEISIRQ